MIFFASKISFVVGHHRPSCPVKLILDVVFIITAKVQISNNACSDLRHNELSVAKILGCCLQGQDPCRYSRKSMICCQ